MVMVVDVTMEPVSSFVDLLLKLTGGVGEDTDLNRPDTDDDFRLEGVVELHAELVLKRRIITIDSKRL